MAEPVSEGWDAVPTPRLRQLVSAYRGSRHAGFPPGIHRGLPTSHLEFIVCLADPIHLTGLADPDRPAASFSALAAGLQTRPVVIEHDGTSHTVSLELTPAGTRSLFGLPAGELVDTVVDLDHVLGRDAHELVERLAAATDWPTCGAILDEVLARRAGRSEPDEADVAYVWQRIVDSEGMARIGELATEIAYSRRHLTKRFTREYGITPKQLARIVRFERSRAILREIERRRRCDSDVRRPLLSEIAAKCGYYDQAHLAREWNDLAGCPPSVWLDSEELPFVLAPSEEPAAVSRA